MRNTVNDYGVAATYDFDNPQKWYTVPSVPLLDEHCMSDENGRDVAQVDRSILEEIANNNNQRVKQTGDPATLILGHTSDDPRAPEKPAKGFVVNYTVKPFKRDPQTGQVIYAIHGDYKIRHQNKHLLEEYPRRSVELWWQKKELDPIAMLGGSSPERDLGVVIRRSRLNHISLDTLPANQRTEQAVERFWNPDAPIQFSTRGKWAIEHYSIEQKPKRFAMNNGNGKTNYNCGPNGKMRYEDDDMDTGELNDYDGGDESIPTETDDDVGGGTGDENDPVLAKVFQSKQWKDISSKIDMMFQAITGSGNEPGMPPDGMREEPGMGEMPPPGQPGMPPSGMAPPPGAEGMGDGFEPEEEGRRQHGQEPVQMEASTGFPGPTDTNVPDFGRRKMNRSTPTNGRNGKIPMNRTQQQQRNPQNDRLTRLEKENRDLKFKYAKSEASQLVATLEQEGILFGDTPEEAAQAKEEQTTFFTHLLMQQGGEEDVAYEADVIRKRYKRKRPDPATPSRPGVARFARPQVGNGQTTTEDEEYESDDPERNVEYANLVALKKMSRKDATAAMRKKYGRS